MVYEIKERIAEFFAKLGYASYVKHLHVYTFHAFAVKHMKPDSSDDLEDVLHKFSLKLKGDEDFGKAVASRYKAILVDEFQDMNEDFYNVLLVLQKASGAGMMVIGDDDHNIGTSLGLAGLTQFLQIAVFPLQAQGIHHDRRIMGLSHGKGTK